MFRMSELLGVLLYQANCIVKIMRQTLNSELFLNQQHQAYVSLTSAVYTQALDQPWCHLELVLPSAK